MKEMEASYQALSDDSESITNSKVKIHLPTSSSTDARWCHIEDLDLFFSRIYMYHQRCGFLCICLKGILELISAVFMIVLLVFFRYYIDYDILFRRTLPKNSTEGLNMKVTLSDAICPTGYCFSQISLLAWLIISIVMMYWIFRLIKLIYNLYYFRHIKHFYNRALGIPDHHLCNITWQEILEKVCEAQKEHQMCIQKPDLTELDIYHRILRSKNYMVAIVNKQLLPVHFNIPLIGTVTYFSQGFKYAVEMLLFSGTWGFFDNWNLKEDYKKSNKRQELAAKLQSSVVFLAIAYAIFGILIFAWQIVYFFFNYTELVKKEPGLLALRSWSLYGRIYLRHFNELDHELDMRLRRAHRPATKYMSTFSSPVMVIISKNGIFMAGSVLTIFLIMSIYDDAVLTVERVVGLMTILGVLVAFFKVNIPDENMYWCPENLMVGILTEVHYLPDNWRGQAHSSQVRDQFTQFFQYKMVALLFELISPIVTPFILFFHLRPRALDIVDFFRNFTVMVQGVGDVCSFSLMDMRKHGNPAWQAPGHLACPENNKQTQAEDGKTELSLIHFAAMNPHWKAPENSQQEFIHDVREKVWQQPSLSETDKHLKALSSCALGLSVILSQHNPAHSVDGASLMQSYNPYTINGDPIREYQENGAHIPSLDASVTALHLHSLHHRKLRDKSTSQHITSLSSSNVRIPMASTSNAFERTPLLPHSSPRST